MTKRPRDAAQLTLPFSVCVERKERGWATTEPRGNFSPKVVPFVDAKTIAARHDAVARVISAEIFSVRGLPQKDRA